MLPHVRSSPRRPQFGAPANAPFRYVRIPDHLLRAALHNPRVIAVYALVARTWLVRGDAAPISASDLVAFDPSLSRGAAQRAIAWLTAAGWLHGARVAGAKSRLTPTWGQIHGAARLWTTADSRYGRPPHIKAMALDTRLLDLYMGRLVPFAGQRAARVTRYVAQAALTLEDVGRYALLAAGYGGAPSAALAQLGLTSGDHAQPLAADQAILAQLSQLPLTGAAGAGLNHAGLRRAGLVPADDDAPAQPLFFVPHALIANMAAHSIDHLIDQQSGDDAPIMASGRAQPGHTPREVPPAGIPWESNDTQEKNQPARTKAGGGHMLAKKMPAPLPATPSAERLHAFHVAPESIRAFADLPLDLIDACIAYAEATRGIHSKQGWVVWALGAYRAYGFRPGPAGGDQPVDWAALARAWPQALGGADDPAGNVVLAAPAHDMAVPPSVLPDTTLCQTHGDVTDHLIAACQAAFSPSAWRGWAACMASARAWCDGSVVAVTMPPAAFRQALDSELHLALRQIVRAWSPASPLALRLVAAAPSDTPPAPAAPPAWIAGHTWAALPALLRAALQDSHLEHGEVHFRTSALAAFAAQRHAEELAHLLRVAGSSAGG